MITLERLVRDYLDMFYGKIVWRRYIYLFLPAPARKQRIKRAATGEYMPIRTDCDGREFAAFRGRGAHCSNPDLWVGKFPRLQHMEKTYHIVPAANCKACQFHDPGHGNRRHSCCLWDREWNKSHNSP